MKFSIQYAFILLTFTLVAFCDTSPLVIGTVTECSGFTSIQRDFSNQQISKGAKIYSSDQITCDNGKVHLTFGPLHLWMGKNSKIIHRHETAKHSIHLVKGNFLIKVKGTAELNYSVTTDIVKISNLTNNSQLHINSHENSNQIISLKNPLTIVQKDIQNRHYKIVDLKEEHVVNFTKFKNATLIRKLESIESVYYKEYLLLPSEISNTGPKSLDSFKPYLPQKEVISKSKKWLRMNKDENILNQTQLSNFKNFLNLSSELSHENLNEALLEDDAFTFPEPIDVPVSTQ